MDEVKKMEDGLKTRTDELGYQMQPNCGMMSAQLAWQLSNAGITYIACAHLQLAVPVGKKGGHQVVGCRPASCAVKTITDSDREGVTYEQWDMLVDLTNWNENPNGIVRTCFQGGDGVIQGIGSQHQDKHYYLGGHIRPVKTECPYPHQFGCP